MNAPPGLPPDATPLKNVRTLAGRLAQEIDQFDAFEALRLVSSGNEAAPLPVSGAVTNRYVATPLRQAPGSFSIETAFVGLVGPLTPLPPLYTETALREKKRRSPAMRAFLDVFVTRIVSLFVKAFEKYRLPPLVGRHGTSGKAQITAALYALVGLGLPSLRDRMLTADSRLLPYTGLLVGEVRSAAGLEVILADLLGLPVKVSPMQVRWLDIAPEEQSRLGVGGFCTLGVDVVAGARTRDVTSTFRIILGPVDYSTFQSFEPGGAVMTRLVEVTRFYMDCGLDFEVQIVLRKEDVPECHLGDTPPRLGWNGWLRQLPALTDADQALFDPGTI